MQRTVSDLFAQSNQQSLDAILPRVKRLKCPIIDVLFPSHSFVVLRSGYGRQIVQADSNVDFGTYARPLVAVNNYVWIEYNDSDGTWHATKYETSPNCSPTTPPHVPNVPFTTAVPPLDTRTMLEPFNIDTNFNPHVNSIGLLAPASKSPPITGGATTKVPAYRSRCYITFFDTNYEFLPADVSVSNNYLYAIVASGSGPTYFPILVIYDISDVGNPLFVSKTNLTSVVTADSIIVRGYYAYISGRSGTNEVGVWDVSDPFLPIKVGALAGTFGLGNMTSFTVLTSRYVARSYAGNTNIIDVTTPATPASVATIAFGLVSWGTTEPYDSTRAEGAYLHIHTGTALRVYDVTTPATPAFVGSVAIASGKGLIWAKDDKTIVCGKTNGFCIVDVSTPATPTIISTVVLPGFFPGANGLHGSGDYLYVTSSTGVIATYDISTPATPALVGTTNLIDPSNGVVGHCIVDRTHLFTCEQLANNNFNNNPGVIGIYDLFGTG